MLTICAERESWGAKIGDVPDYDAVLVVSFGGPERADDVMPFLQRVTRGRDVPRRRLLDVAERYFQAGGVSPINEQTRELITALTQRLDDDGPRLPIYWGNRNWHPLLSDTMQTMAAAGVERTVAFVTSAFSSFSSCRQYLDDIEAARMAVGPTAPIVDKIRPFWNHPGFVEASAARVREAVLELLATTTEELRLVFTAHSIPSAMAAACDYEAQLREAATLVAERAATELAWDLVYQSRSGRPDTPWLGPDILDHLTRLRDERVAAVVVCPIGFVSDHMEVVYDLDIEAQALARRLGIRLARAGTVGTSPRFVDAVRELIVERVEGATPVALGTLGPRPACTIDCCPPS